MAPRLCLFLLAAAAAVLFVAECMPVEQPEEKEKESLKLFSDTLIEPNKPSGIHILEKRADRTATTLEDALNIPIAALEAVRRLLTNRFETKQPEGKKE